MMPILIFDPIQRLAICQVYLGLNFEGYDFQIAHNGGPWVQACQSKDNNTCKLEINGDEMKVRWKFTDGTTSEWSNVVAAC